MAAVDYFLKIDGIPGESTDDKHKNEIEIESFSWGVTQIGSATGGAGAGKVRFNEFKITKSSDKSSPVLFKACATGQHLKIAVFTARKAGERREEFLKITMSDILVSSYQSGGASLPPVQTPPPTDIAALSQNLTTGNALTTGSGDPADAVSLNYAKIEYLEGNPQRIGVAPTASGQLTFDAKTGQVQVGDWNGDGVTTVGMLDGNIMRAVREYDVKILIGLLQAPFGNASLHLLVNEMRGPATTPGEIVDAAALGSEQQGPSPHMRFDVLLLRGGDGVVNASDLTRPGKRIGQLSVDPSDPSGLASLDIDLGPILEKHSTDMFGIRLQLHGAGIPEPLETAADRDEEEGETNPQDVAAQFSMGLVLDTA